MISGIHHITAIASDPQQCVDFYVGVLGLRLVKKSVNQDQVQAYHLFFGDKTGEPGMDLTFFTFPGIGRGESGAGAVTLVSLAVPESSLDFWFKRLQSRGIACERAGERFDFKRLAFQDFDGQRLELVGVPSLETITDNVWTTEEMSLAHAIRHFHAARITLHSDQVISGVLALMGYEKKQTIDTVTHFQLPQLKRAEHLEVTLDATAVSDSGMVGCVHHIAFAVADEAEELTWREKLRELGLQPTQVIDRYYFKSVYFRLPEGVLFELATMGPGFAVDEPEKSLGEKLALPPFLEHQREAIEAQLIPIKTS
jgi:glyoxalase family protein